MVVGGKWTPERRQRLAECRRQEADKKYLALGYVKWDGSMPIPVGVFAHSQDVGFSEGGIRIWVVCPDCGYGRWVLKSDIGRSRCKTCDRKCLSCKSREMRGELHPSWKGGRRVDKESGYVFITIDVSNPFVAMAKRHGGRSGRDNSFIILEHRLVMAQYLGFLLKPWEIVHHINGDKADNRIENLELLPNRTNHLPYTVMQNEIRDLEGRVTVLEAENTLLKVQLGLVDG